MLDATRSPTTSGDERDLAAEQLAEPLRDRRQRVLRVGLALRPPEVRAARRPSRRCRAATAIVGSAAVMRRSSSITPSRSGTLKSARSSTRVPVAQREVLELRNRVDHAAVGGATWRR